MHHWTRLIGWLSFGLIITASFILVLRYVEKAHFFYLGLETFFVLLFLSYKLKKHNFLKAFSFNLAIVILLLGLAEAYFAWFSAAVKKENKVEMKNEILRGPDNYYIHGKGSDNYYIHDEIRGYAVPGNVKISSKKIVDDKVIYDVIYTTNQHGLRLSPHDLAPSNNYLNKHHKNAVFFGDSLTFGMGVNDSDTLPYLFEEMSNSKYISYNFGFIAYGAHQMLRIIETGLIDRIITDNQPMVVIYQALIEHIDRASGNLLWHLIAPRYRLSDAGTVEYVGNFKGVPNAKNKQGMSRLVNTSNLLDKIVRSSKSERSEKDIELFIKIIIRSKKLLEQKYNAKFYIIMWPWNAEGNYDNDANYVINKLIDNKIDLISVDQIFKRYWDPPQKYLIPMDNHPTKLAHERIAKYLLENLN